MFLMYKKLITIYFIAYLQFYTFGPPDNGRIYDHYFYTWCPSVRPSEKKTKTRCNANVFSRKTKYSLKMDNMHEDNDHLMAVAWWVIINLLNFVFYLRSFLVYVVYANEVLLWTNQVFCHCLIFLRC